VGRRTALLPDYDSRAALLQLLFLNVTFPFGSFDLHNTTERVRLYGYPPYTPIAGPSLVSVCWQTHVVKRPSTMQKENNIPIMSLLLTI
jgi:hypothetical protein